MSIQLLFVLFVKAVIGDNIIRIHNANDFIEFSKNVSSRNNYLGTTVYLGSDLSLSGKTLEPIDNFRGIFDGQGHIISDLKMNTSTSQSTGLFGNSNGLTIRNVVLDSSCSMTNTYNGSNVYIGGIVGSCYSNSRECTIKDNVNMADVTFSADTNYNQHIGGIAGYLYSSSHPIYLKNCANYGSITRSEASVNSHIGGIVGYSYRSSSSSYISIQNCVNYGAITHNGKSGYLYIGGIVGYGYSYIYIQNCLNYGAITHNETSEYLYIGGIVGYGYSYIYIQNCLNYGEITRNGTSEYLCIGGIICTSYSNTSVQNCMSAGKIVTNKESNRIGSIVGYVSYSVHINYCYFTSDVNVNSIYGTGTPESTTGTPDSPTDVSSELVNKLNSNTTGRNWNNWFILHLNGGSINNLAQDPFIGIQGHIPNPVKEGNRFLFWCKDAECTEEFDPETETVSGITDIYAAWVNNTVTFDFDNGTIVNAIFSYNTEIMYPKREGYTLSWDNYHELMAARDITITAQWTPNNYTVTFDFDNGTTVNVTFSYNTEIIYLDPKKEGYTFNQWDNYHELMPANSITVTAQWTPNIYTVTFDANGGNISETSTIVTFNKEYGELPEPKRTEYVFIGWFTDKTNGTEVTNETIVTTPDNHTLYAQWEKVTNHVEIVFYAKDLTKEEVNNFIEQYAKAGIEIVRYEKEPGGIRIIIKFDDEESAEGFFKSIKESDKMNLIKRITFDQRTYYSISAIIYPLTFFDILFL